MKNKIWIYLNWSVTKYFLLLNLLFYKISSRFYIKSCMTHTINPPCSRISPLFRSFVFDVSMTDQLSAFFPYAELVSNSIRKKRCHAKIDAKNCKYLFCNYLSNANVTCKIPCEVKCLCYVMHWVLFCHKWQGKTCYYGIRVTRTI